MSYYMRSAAVTSSREKYKDERKEVNGQRDLEYYYKNIEKRREYNENYWKEKYVNLYSKRLLKINCDDIKLNV